MRKIILLTAIIMSMIAVSNPANAQVATCTIAAHGGLSGDQRGALHWYDPVAGLDMTAGFLNGLVNVGVSMKGGEWYKCAMHFQDMNDLDSIGYRNITAPTFQFVFFVGLPYNWQLLKSSSGFGGGMGQSNNLFAGSGVGVMAGPSYPLGVKIGTAHSVSLFMQVNIGSKMIGGFLRPSYNFLSAPGLVDGKTFAFTGEIGCYLRFGMGSGSGSF